jgi:hypothetical protein
MHEQIRIYLGLWTKYRLPILQKMRAAEAEQAEQFYTLYLHEFQALGTRVQSGYSFNLEISNGRVSNNIAGTAVARDLYEMLKQSEAAKKLMENRVWSFKMGRDFKLKISSQAIASQETAQEADV